jgi:hypothetical protein
METSTQVEEIATRIAIELQDLGISSKKYHEIKDQINLNVSVDGKKVVIIVKTKDEPVI